MKRECLKIIGTAHVSQESVDEVKDAIYEQHPDVVAIELDRATHPQGDATHGKATGWHSAQPNATQGQTC